MSLKIERDTFQQGVQQGPGPSSRMSMAGASSVASGGRIPGTSGKHPIAETVGTALTGGKQNAGTKGYLAVRVSIPTREE